MGAEREVGMPSWSITVDKGTGVVEMFLDGSPYSTFNPRNGVANPRAMARFICEMAAGLLDDDKVEPSLIEAVGRACLELGGDARKKSKVSINIVDPRS